MNVKLALQLHLIIWLLLVVLLPYLAFVETFQGVSFLAQKLLLIEIG